MDLNAMARKYFVREIEGLVFIIVVANEEMSIDQAIKCICNFRSPQLKKEFMEAENLSCFKLFPGNDEINAELGQITPEKRTLFQQMKESIHLVVDSVSEAGSTLLRSGLMKEVQMAMKQVKSGWIVKSKKIVKKSVQKTEYLKVLIREIIEKFSKDSDEQVVQKIISYGGIDPVIIHTLFAMEVAFREKFKNILYSCKTFKQLKLYRGEDIQLIRGELVDQLTACLVELEFNEDAADAILKEMKVRPLSNIVANRTDLTNQQKQAYYRSEFYRSEIIIKYPHILNYEQSLESKVKEQIGEILKKIEDWTRITREVLDCLLNFRFFNLLQITTIKPIKTSIYQFVIKNCPNYYKMFKLVKYQQKSPSTFGESECDFLRIELISIFQKIHLQFDQWELAQDKIMSRNYSIIDDLTLKQKGKYDLMQHIIFKIEPYFHQQEKEINYRSQIELVLLEAIMATEISEASFNDILTIIEQTLDSNNYTSQFIMEMSKKMQNLYQGVLSNPKFKDFVANNRRDVKEEQYKKRWQLRKQILENNFEDKIDVPYEAIDEFIEKIIMDDGKIPTNYHQHVTDLIKLRGGPIVPVEEEVIVLVPPPQQQSIEQLAKKFNEASQRLFSVYTAQGTDSFLEGCFKIKFDQNASNLVRKMMETKVFSDENSTFFSDLGYNLLITKRFRSEISTRAGNLTTQIQECVDILKKLHPQGSFAHISSQGSVSNQDNRAQCAAFVERYKSKFEESILEKIWQQKYDSDSMRFVQALKAQKAFINPDSPFFNNLGMNALLTKRTKMEFARNAEWAMKQLEVVK